MNIDGSGGRFKRSSKQKQDDEEKQPPPVSKGTAGKVLDIIYNATPEKEREVTVIDRIQGRLLPQLDLVNAIWEYVIALAEYREGSRGKYQIVDGELVIPEAKTPEKVNLITDYIHRLAQWQKSVGGASQKGALDLALAEIESQREDEGETLGGFGED